MSSKSMIWLTRPTAVVVSVTLATRFDGTHLKDMPVTAYCSCVAILVAAF